MSKSLHAVLSRRERQIMDIIYARGQATSAEVLEGLPDPPGYSAVRAMLRVLEEKGHLRHEARGPRYVFLPTVPREKARRSALRQLVHTFFDGSTEKAVAALLDLSSSKMSGDELDRLADLADDPDSDRETAGGLDGSGAGDEELGDRDAGHRAAEHDADYHDGDHRSQ